MFGFTRNLREGITMIFVNFHEDEKNKGPNLIQNFPFQNFTIVFQNFTIIFQNCPNMFQKYISKLFNNVSEFSKMFQNFPNIFEKCPKTFQNFPIVFQIQ